MRGLLAAVAVFVVATLGAAHASAAPEVVKSFVADITVQQNGDLHVSETITVHAAGINIKRGIYRDFPTIYSGPLGLRDTVGFDIVEVLRDGKVEPYFTEVGDNGIRLYIGDADVYLAEGDYTYTIVYETDRQLRYDENYDELYWNVTGNGWVFPIDRVEARVKLPPGDKPLDIVGYTGAYGETGQNYKSSVEAGDVVYFATTRRLAPYEGFTIAVSWPKGFVAEPDAAARAWGLLGSNLGILVGLIGLIATVVYFLVFWNRVGRDPDKGVVIPLFSPPENMPPVVVGYAANWGFGMGFQRSRAFAVALTSMATKGAVTIEANEDKSYTVTRTDDPPKGLSDGEQKVYGSLFRGGTRSVTMDRTYDPTIRSAVDLLAKLIGKDYTDVYFRTNRSTWLGGAILAVAGAAIAAVIDTRSFESLITVGFVSVFGLAFSFGAGAMWVRIGPAFANAIRRPSLQLVSLLVGGVAAALFSIPAIGAIGAMATLVTFPVFVLVLLNAGVVVLFWFLMKAPTMHGRKVMDQIEGYKLYLSVAEADRMNMLGDEPVMSLQLFERHLPYAMALGVEDKWTKHFEAQIPPEQRDRIGSQPSWYRSHGGSGDLSSMASTLSSGMVGTISSAATRPSSSSSGGSSGGGSSGGGGGGGGGGGW